MINKNPRQIPGHCFGPKLLKGLPNSGRLAIDLGGQILELLQEPDGSIQPLLRSIPEGYTVLGTSDCISKTLMRKVIPNRSTRAYPALVENRQILIHLSKSTPSGGGPTSALPL